ncbi:MAG: energy-coupling factor ABC transporter ATP-binding protein [Xenococcus sp. (in: cyanobacteria)]
MKSSISKNHQNREKPSAIIVDDVSFSWSAEDTVLQSCSLEVPQGEFWMLLGNNGSGKSTLLKLLTGLLIPDSGTATIANTFGLVFQNPDLQLVMPTVAADIAFGLVAENLSAIEVRERVRAALDAVNLLDLERRPIYALSGGQKQRIAIAGALARNCETILFDEPTALLDCDTQIELVQQVQNLVKTQGITALWVTHRLEELDYCDGAFLLENGQVTAQGNPKVMKNKLLQKQSQDL